MLRNREIAVFTLTSALITALAAGACFAKGAAAGFICLAGCLGVFGACGVFTMRRYKAMAQLSAYLKRLAQGKPALNISDNAEGELSILKNEIYKATTALSEQADSMRRDKLELATALSDISHQLKTPLTSLGIMADLLENDELPPKKRREFISSMRERLYKMEWLVLALLKIARLDADAVKLKPVSVALSRLVEKAVEPMLIPMDIKAQAYCAGGEDTAVTCDPNWTAEALGNIIKNAVENTPEGGKVTVLYGSNPLYAHISVYDGGPGIAREDMPHLFDRFYRGKGASRDSAGIGLAMSLAIMRKQNATIEAANEGGGVFTLKFYR